MPTRELALRQLVAANIADAARQHGLSHAGLARRASVSRSQLLLTLNASCSAGLARLSAIAWALEVPLAALVRVDAQRTHVGPPYI